MGTGNRDRPGDGGRAPARPTADRPTLASVAAAAGVSRQTVSNVLNAPARVAPSTRAHVRAVIAALGYRPDRLARSLRTRASLQLGYRIPPAPAGALNPVLDRFLYAVTDAAADHGYHLLLFTRPPEPGDDLDRYAELAGQRAVDGFVLADPVAGDPRPGWLADRGVPFGMFGRTRQDPEPGRWVDVDQPAGTALAVGHVHARGHRRVAFLGWPTGTGVGDDRLTGYRSACRRLGLTPSVVRVEPEPGQDLGPGYRAAARVLAGPRPPTALVCVSDLCAYGALQAVHGHGLRPGHDVAVVGFDDTPAAALPGVDLTSVSQPVEQAGRAVVDRLVADLWRPGPGPGRADAAAPPDPADRADAAAPGLLLAPGLVVRGSTVPG